MTTTPKPESASDAQVEEFFELLQSFGCETDHVDGKLMGRCSVCFGPWFDPEDTTDQIRHSDDCSSVVGPSVKARIEADRAQIKRCHAIMQGLVSYIDPEEADKQVLDDAEKELSGKFCPGSCTTSCDADRDADRARIRELQAEIRQLKSRLSTIDN